LSRCPAVAAPSSAGLASGLCAGLRARVAVWPRAALWPFSRAAGRARAALPTAGAREAGALCCCSCRCICPPALGLTRAHQWSAPCRGRPPQEGDGERASCAERPRPLGGPAGAPARAPLRGVFRNSSRPRDGEFDFSYGRVLSVAFPVCQGICLPLFCLPAGPSAARQPAGGRPRRAHDHARSGTPFVRDRPAA